MSADPQSIIQEIMRRTGTDRGRLLDIAREVQARLGWISEESIQAIAEALGVKPVQVRDTVSFYSFLSLSSTGRSTLRLSSCVAGKMRGSKAVEEALVREAGIPFGQTSADGAITLVHTSCTGMCDQSPSALVDGKVLTNLAPQDARKIVDGLLHGSSFSQTRVESNIRQTGPVIFAPLDRGAAIRAALNHSPQEVIEEIARARLRGRGGAGFPTGMKWDFCRKAQGAERYLICNCDEGEMGTFKDRVIITEVPDLVFEGMTIGGYALGAKQGILYLRGEYEYLHKQLEEVLERRRRLGLLGASVCGREGFAFDIRIQVGAGAYICGEESALLESLEGKRGAPRDRPPYPVQRGYLNQPTVVNNVETLCCAARIMEKGADWFTKMGTRDSTGTKLLSVSGDCERPGVYELEFGIVIDRLLEVVGAKDVLAVQVGGPSGQCLAVKDLGKRICFEDASTGGAIMIFNTSRDILSIVRDLTTFFVEDSCGWCAPCRIGTALLLKKMDKILSGSAVRRDLIELESLGNTVKTMSRCGLGQTSANPVLTSLRNFPRLYEQRMQPGDFSPEIDLGLAIRQACEITGRTPSGEGGAR
ncbi:MAG TPA: NAD(P)H-dependent oxidoreductase subunit E [Spirochaetia bacterium]|nr:NAD(P)H-dependent oxidoreductase subunit E [Spirochaetia bacterium]